MEVEMASTTIHTKPDGKRYLYSVESYWDKDKKQPRNRQVCLGRVDDASGEVIPSERKARNAKRAAHAPDVTATAKVIGPSLLLDKVAEETGLRAALQKSMSEVWSFVMSLAYFLAHKGSALSRSEAWSAGCAHPYGAPISSQRISDLLQLIDEDMRQTFFKVWMAHLGETECFFYDITSVSSYSEQNAYVRYGHNRDGEALPQINLAMLYGQESRLPAYYRRIQGSIADVSTLKTTADSLHFIDQLRLTYVLDRGFYSKANVSALLKKRSRFILAVPRRKWVEELYDAEREHILKYPNRIEMPDGEALYAKTILRKWDEKRCYAHVCFNHLSSATEQDELEASLTRWRTELLEERPIKANKWAYEKYFTVKQTPKRGLKVTENKDAVDAARKRYSGFFCLLTTKKMDAKDALETYRRKEAVENSFDDLKNMLDMKRLRIRSSQAMDARLFIQFIALILLSRVRAIAKTDVKTKYLTVREVMENMETLVKIRYSGRYGSIITEPDPLQREIMRVFEVSVDS
jgi:transposase